MNCRLDADLYEPEETIELKIALVLPYPPPSRDFQRVEGTFEHEGQYYKLVKQKFQNDTLYVVCIRDHASRQLVSKMIDYVELTQGLEGAGKSQKALNYPGKLITDFCGEATIGILYGSGYTVIIFFDERRDVFTELAMPVHSPPPRA